MSDWTFSTNGARDFVDVYAYGFEIFGKAVADDYAESLRKCFTRLAMNPRMGRLAESAGAAVRRLEHRRHVVFYEIEPVGAGVRIIAIVHERSIRKFEG